MRAGCTIIVCAFACATLGASDQKHTDVPYVPTPDDVVDAMLDLAAIAPSDVLVDLGSGDGRIVIAAARKFGIRSTGVEIDAELVRQSERLAAQAGVAGKTSFIQADLFQYDLRQASVVTMFLTPGVNLRLRSKLLAELKPGARVVSHRFDMGSWAPAKVVRVQDDPVYLWVVPPKGGAIERAPAAAAPVDPPLPFEKLAAMFAYDSTEPVNARYAAPQASEGASITSVSYAGAKGPVSGQLITPSKEGKHPAVVFAPEYGRSDEFLAEALLLARANPPAISLIVDAPPERPLGWRHNFNSMSGDDNDRDVHIEAVIDIRRGIDVLAGRNDVDTSRIAFVGHGYGANWGAILASLESRLRGFVLVAGVPSLSELLDSDEPEWANMRYALGKERMERYRESISLVDPIRFTSHWAGSPVLLQFGRFDSVVSTAAAERLVQSFPRPPKAVFYDTGHSVNDPRALVDRAGFLAGCIHSGMIQARQLAPIK